MITMRRQLLGLGFVAASSLLALHAAQAMSGPSAITIDGGPVGSLAISGGIDGYGYYVSNTPDGTLSNGANVANALVELQKTSGELQFTIEVGSNGGAVTLGTGRPGQTTITSYSTGPLYAGYVTIAPSALPEFTFSAGQIGSLEGWESGIDWNNANQLTTEIWYVQNSQNRGVEVSYAAGPISATVSFGDGYDTGVFNFIQALATYTINPTNSVSLYYAGNAGTTGLNAKTYGGFCGGCTTTVGSYGSPSVNSQMIGGWYNYTMGNLNLVPEVQYQYAKANARIGLTKPTWNLGTAVFADYAFGTSPYSLGAWVEYWTSHSGYQTADGAGYNNAADWFVGPNSEGVGLSVTPTWQYKDLFARLDGGALYLLNNKGPSTDSNNPFAEEKYGYNNSGTGRTQFIGLLEAGLLF